MSPSTPDTPDWVRLDHEGLNIVIEALHLGEKFHRLRDFLPPGGMCQHWPTAITLQCSSEDEIGGAIDRIRVLIWLLDSSGP